MKINCLIRALKKPRDKNLGLLKCDYLILCVKYKMQISNIMRYLKEYKIYEKKT